MRLFGESSFSPNPCDSKLLLLEYYTLYYSQAQIYIQLISKLPSRKALNVRIMPPLALSWIV